MLFIEKKNKTEKKQKEKEAYHSYRYSLGYYLKKRSTK